jgi:hypothetical protein
MRRSVRFGGMVSRRSEVGSEEGEDVFRGVEPRERPGRRRSGVLGRVVVGESDRDASDGEAGVAERDFERVMRWGMESSEVVTVVDTVVVVVVEMGPRRRFGIRWASSASDCPFVSNAGIEELDVSET